MASSCNHCGAPLVEDAKFCISCGQAQAQAPLPIPAKPKKPIYKRWWFWLIIFLVIGLLTNLALESF